MEGKQDPVSGAVRAGEKEEGPSPVAGFSVPRKEKKNVPLLTVTCFLLSKVCQFEPAGI